ncbi:hypothetical protein, partial [Bifidobacterium longum]|uniref:hypothetical protein n=1 Tax=Bifidobacterium longum TaxID=216816 RepID=UPI001A955EE1
NLTGVALSFRQRDDIKNRFMTSGTNTHAEQQQEPERKHQHVNIEIGQTEKITENHARHYANS